MTDSVFLPLVRPTLQRLFRSPYARSFVAFVTCQLLFLLAVKLQWVPGESAHAGPEAAQTAFLIFSVHVLLSVNTICFLIHVTPVVSHIQHLAVLVPGDKSEIRDASRAFIVFFVVSVFASGSVSVLVALEWFGFIAHKYWKPIISLTEVVSLVLFIYFLAADFCCLDICLRAQRSTIPLPSDERERVSKLANDLKRYILAVDTPGVVGLTLIIICSRTLHPEFVPDLYWEGFIAGAIGLHIMFSQATLGFLSVLGDGDETAARARDAVGV